MTQWGLDTLFNPSKRHMDEEKQRLQSTREQVGDSSGGKRIDLESGKVTIRRADAAEPDADEAAADEADADVAAAAGRTEGGNESEAADADAGADAEAETPEPSAP
ncbi:MAG: DUF6191 domain-containing protein [Jatrophihabitantaceae bacterium]